MKTIQLNVSAIKLCSLIFGICIMIPAITWAENLDAAELRDRCLPEAPLSTLGAIIHAESSGNPNALQIDFPKALLRKWHMGPGILRLQRQPTDRTEALQWMEYFDAYEISYDVGLMQVSSAEARKMHLTPDALLDPCTNLQAGWTILSTAYTLEVQRSGPGQTALRRAISRYNTGDPQAGIDNGYLSRVLEALKHLSREEKHR
jgi:type IV secretion system protein VirB1